MTGWFLAASGVTVTSWPWLLLLFLLPVVYLLSRNSLAGLSRGRRLVAVVLRSAALLLVMLALAGVHLRKRDDRLSVIFVADLSDSIPVEQREDIREFIRKQQEECDFSRGDQIGVVIYGRDAGIEVSPRSEPFDLSDFSTLVDPKATDIESAIRLALAAFPEDVGGKRLVILSDGNENVGRAHKEIRAARSLGVTVDVVPVTYAYPREIRIEKLIVEPQLLVGEPHTVRAIVHSTVDTDVRFHFYEGNNVVPQSDPIRRLKKGRNQVSFPDLRRDAAGSVTYDVEIEPLNSEDDAILENNRASGFAMVRGEPKVLVCASEPELEKALEVVLRIEKIGVDLVTPEFLPREIQDYLEYDAVILSNVGAHQLTKERMNLIEGLVKGLGLGLVMVGGEESFGAGGYQGTPVERVLPVDMEIKHKKVLPNGALAMVVHSCELSNGNEWGRRVIQQAIKILSPRDYAGVIYYSGSQEKWLFPMTQCTKKQLMISRLRNFNPGDMLSFQPIMQMALRGLKNTQASVKHMIVFSDGDPTAPTQALVDEIVKENRITISTICYGAHGGIPPEMRWLANQGRGKFYHLTNPRDLPEIFIREASTVRKSLISEETFTPVVPPGEAPGPILAGIDTDGLPPLLGYVLTSRKSLANTPLVHPGSEEDPTTDPLLATWRYGLGKSVAFTSDAGRRWGAGWAAWPGYQRFWSQLVRWVSRSRRDDRFRATRQLDGDKARIVVEAFDEAGGYLNDLDLQGRVVSPAPEHQTTPVAARQVGLGRYLLEFSVKESGTYIASLQSVVDGSTVNFSTGITVPYSPEYRHLSTNHELLRKLASAGSGRYVLGDVDLFSRDFPTSYSIQEIWRHLLTIAVCLFFADVFIRRVLIDYAATWAKVTALAGVLRARGKADEKKSDARLAGLLRRKAEVREKTQHGPQRKERPAAVPTTREKERESEEVAALDAAFDAGATVERSSLREEPRSGPKETRSPSPAQAQEESTYSRLLQAKKRALRRDDKED